MNYFSLPGIYLPLLDAVTTVYGVSHRKLKSKSRKYDIVRARQAYFYMAVKSRAFLSWRSYAEIGRELNRSHCDVLYSVRTVERDLMYPTIRWRIEDVCKIARINFGQIINNQVRPGITNKAG